MITEQEQAAYIFECDAAIAQTIAAQQMRYAFLNQSRFCRYCLWMRDLSIHLRADGSCVVCAKDDRQ